MPLWLTNFYVTLLISELCSPFLAEMLLRHWGIIFRDIKVDICSKLSGISIQKISPKTGQSKNGKMLIFGVLDF